MAPTTSTCFRQLAAIRSNFTKEDIEVRPYEGPKTLCGGSQLFLVGGTTPAARFVVFHSSVQSRMEHSHVRSDQQGCACHRGLARNRRGDRHPADDEWAEPQLAATALKRYGNVDDIAPLVAFVAGPEAGYITGASRTVDGGTNA
jgi:hypothetical protein